jgi:SAM-dependent methyltransferase
MSNYSEIVNTIFARYNNNQYYKINISEYNKTEISVIIATIINKFSFYNKKEKVFSSYKDYKYYRLMYYVYELLQLCDKEVYKTLLDSTSYLDILSYINNGAIILYKLKNVINISKTKKLEYCYKSTEYGSYNNFKFWYDDIEIYNLIKNSSTTNTLLLIKSVTNPDDRIYKFIIGKTTFTEQIIKSIILCLDSALHIPLKYKIKRIKLLSNYININEYFNTIIFNLYDHRLITYLYKVVIRTNNHTYSEIVQLCKNCKTLGYSFKTLGYSYDYDNIIYNNLKELYKYLNDQEKNFVVIYIGNNIITPELHFSSSIRNLIKDNYKSIILNLLQNNNLFKINNKTIKILCEEKLFNKYLYNECIESTIHKELLLFTRFYNNNKTDCKEYIKYNKLLHLLRTKMKYNYNKKIYNHLNKVILLNNEISNYKPKNIPVLKKGSTNYQYNKQQFTNIPPRHLIATLNNNLINELQVHTTFLLREKPDGILVDKMPTNIFPSTDLFNNIKIKAEYIEEYDLYLVFDIDIPNTTILERYEILRKAHTFTNNTKIKQINNLNEFMIIMHQERELINNLMQEKKKIKWYPKFAALYNNNDNNEIVNNFIDFINSTNENFKYTILKYTILKYTILKSKYYNCDGLILSPLINYYRDIKIKPNNLLSIDLLYNGTHFINYENMNMNSILSIDNTDYKINGIYRCYPDIFYKKFIIRELRLDKHKPNNNTIINNICNLLKYKYQTITCDYKIDQNVYYEKKGIINNNLLQQLKDQTKLLNNILLFIDPKNKKKWLDLGCGNGKLLKFIDKFNPEYYIGFDSDINKLIEGSTNNSINFIHTDLNKEWSSNIQIKFDYIIANFSIMHFFTDIFWEQLNNVSNKNAIFIFNTPSDRWQYNNSHMSIDNEFTYYHFEWVHNDKYNKKEPYINKELIYSTAKKYNWSVNIYHDRQYLNNVNKPDKKLVDCYSWFILTKN